MSGIRVLGERKPRGRLSRIWVRGRAALGGYFWLPCPVCGDPFGGHELGGGDLLLEQGHSAVTCPRCPGFWLRTERGIVEIKPRINDSGDVELTFIRSSTACAKTVNAPETINA